MIRDLTLLVVGVGGVAVVAVGPALWYGVGDVLLLAGAAVGVCLTPAALTLAWSSWASRGSPERQLLAVMGGTVVRMLVVLGAGMVLFQAVPALHRTSFWIWVIGFYLTTLTIE